jgi:ubiquinone/menaquinone biosynthesis C-methylase UbiE
MSIKSLSDLESFWSDFQPAYESKLGQTMSLFNHSLIHMLNLKSASSILELGCGPGLGTLALVRRLKDESNLSAKVTACDLSPAMVACARKRLPGRVTVQVANNQSLPFEAASFDRVMAGMNLNLVPEPRQMLAEVFRVLKPGGRTALSVWGRPEESFALTVFNEACVKIGVEVPAVRSNFHIGTIDKLKPMVKDAGFCEVVAWHQPTVYCEVEAEEYAMTLYAAPNRRNAVKEMEKEKRQELHEVLVEMIRAKIEDEETPLQLDGLMVVANKPLN